MLTEKEKKIIEKRLKTYGTKEVWVFRLTLVFVTLLALPMILGSMFLIITGNPRVSEINPSACLCSVSFWASLLCVFMFRAYFRIQSDSKIITKLYKETEQPKG